jgi:hypothetical protein
MVGEQFRKRKRRRSRRNSFAKEEVFYLHHHHSSSCIDGFGTPDELVFLWLLTPLVRSFLWRANSWRYW